MTSKGQYGEESQAVHAHLGIMQSVIQRMASNSTACKAWCIALVSAILVLVTDKGVPKYTLIALIPTLLFFVLDSYYLALEKLFRNSYNSFIEKLHTGRVEAIDLYAVAPKGNVVKAVFVAVTSFSVWPFYLTILTMTLIARFVLFSSS